MLPLAAHHLVQGILDRILQDTRMVDHRMMHSFVDLVLEFRRIFGDGDVAQCRERSAPSCLW